jgi:hypothetical protein
MNAGRTFYDLLEVARHASAEVIQASFEKLRDTLDPDLPGNLKDDASRLKYNALKQAFVTLSNPERRKQYDARLRSLEHVETIPPFWTLARIIVLLVCIGTAFGLYWRAQAEEAKLELARMAVEKERAAKLAAETEERESRAAAQAKEIQKATMEQRQRHELEAARREAEQITRQNDSARDAYERQLQIARQRAEAVRARDREMAEAEARRRATMEERRLRELEYARLRSR